MAYIKKIWKDYPDTTTPIIAADMNNIEDGIEAVDTVVNSGWIDANETWTYASVDDPTGVITISGDKTTKYSLGMRIMFTNGGNVIYGIITAISYSSPNTTMTFLHEIDPTDSLALHLMANSAITANYYSTMKVPYGFPIDPNKWTVKFTTTTQFTQLNPVQNQWYNAYAITIPIGEWQIGYDTCVGVISTAAQTAVRIKSTLSTGNNSESDVEFTSYAGMTSASASLIYISQVYKSKPISVATKTIFYLNEMTTSTAASISSFNMTPAGLQTTIRAVCAYL